MTLKTTMAADVADVFLDTDGHAESVTFYPAGSEDNKSTVTAVVDRSHEEGSREVHGDGLVRNRPQGERLRRSIVLELSTDVAVDDTRREHRDYFKVDSEMFVVQRILGRDDDMQSVLCVRVDPIREKQPAMRG